MDGILWTLFLMGIAVAAYIGLTTFVFRRKVGPSVDPLYIEGLEALADGERERAIRSLRKSAEKSPGSIGPYLILGDLLRNRGDLDRALQIHRELTIRPHLERRVEQRIYRSLALDLMSARRYNQAIAACHRLLTYDKDDPFALETLLLGYEGEERWEDAIETAKACAQRVYRKGSSFLAHYLTHVGERIQGGSPDLAKRYFKRALSLDPSCVPAYLQLGDAYFSEGKYERALTVWNHLLKKDPRNIHYVSDRMERAYFESGAYSQMIEVYERLHEKLPEDVGILLGLAQIHLKKGDLGPALRLAQEARALAPRHPRVYSILLDLYHESGEDKPALRMVKEFFASLPPDREEQRCRRCGHAAFQPFWRCAECKAWQMEFE